MDDASGVRSGPRVVAAPGVERAAAGEGLSVGPPEDTRELAAILAAAARLAPVDLAPDETLRHGDHLLNPDLAPRAGDPAPRRAAVLIALAADAAGDLCVVFTERAAHLSAHPGQISLPGGRIEPRESAAEAAVREAFEEVALPPAAVRPLGLGDPYATRTGFLVIPVLALVVRPAVLAPDRAEVAAAFTVPFRNALSAAHRREATFVRDGVTRRFYETTFAGRRIWGATAGILKLVAERLEIP